MPPVGFELAIPANERRQTHAIDCAATGIRYFRTSKKKIRAGLDGCTQKLRFRDVIMLKPATYVNN
jgi:hypothetical protein